MTEIIYMKGIDDCYIRTFEAEVTHVDEEEMTVVLTQSAFYPEGGGQPSDRGRLTWSGGDAIVDHVEKKHSLKHHLIGELPSVGIEVYCEIDWERRFSHMRMHTAQHLLSAVIWDRFKAATVGNQIHATHSHIDFCPASFSMEELKEVEEEVNIRIKEGHKIDLRLLSKESIEERLGSARIDLSRLPISIKELRTVMIGEGGSIDICPCAGTHVRSLSEIGGMSIIKRKSKGSGKVRVEYELENNF